MALRRVVPLQSPWIPVAYNPQPAALPFYPSSMPQQQQQPTRRRRQQKKSPVAEAEEKALVSAQGDYAALIGTNLVVVSAAIAVFGHMGFILWGQSTFQHATVADIVQGPLLVTVTAGLLALSNACRSAGVPDRWFLALRIPLLAILLGTGVWAIASDAGAVDDFSVHDWGKDLLALAPEAIAWFALAALVGTAAVVSWGAGGLRLEKQSIVGVGTFVFGAVVLLVTCGLSFMFAAILGALDAVGDRTSAAYAVSYVLAVVAVAIFVAACFNGIELAMDFLGGRLDLHFNLDGDGPPGAMMSYTMAQQAYRSCIGTVVAMTAALMWRRRRGLQETGPGTSVTAITTLFLCGFVAVFAETARIELSGNRKLAFDTGRSIVIAFVILGLGLGFLPWSGSLALLLSAAGLFVGMQSIATGTNGLAGAAAICGTLFAYGLAGLRGAAKPGLWLHFTTITAPAILLFIAARFADRTYDGPWRRVSTIYAVCTLVFLWAHASGWTGLDISAEEHGSAGAPGIIADTAFVFTALLFASGVAAVAAPLRGAGYSVDTAMLVENLGCPLLGFLMAHLVLGLRADGAVKAFLGELRDRGVRVQDKFRRASRSN